MPTYTPKEKLLTRLAAERDIISEACGVTLRIRKLSAGELDEYEIHRAKSERLPQKFQDEKTGKDIHLIDWRGLDAMLIQLSVVDPQTHQQLFAVSERAAIDQWEPDLRQWAARECRLFNGLASEQEETPLKNSPTTPISDSGSSSSAGELAAAPSPNSTSG